MYALLAIATLFSPVAEAGTFVHQSLYNPFLAVGTGSTRKEAMLDAKSAIPKGSGQEIFEFDSEQNSPTLLCMDAITWTQATECNGGPVQYLIPLKKTVL